MEDPIIYCGRPTQISLWFAVCLMLLLAWFNGRSSCQEYLDQFGGCSSPDVLVLQWMVK